MRPTTVLVATVLVVGVFASQAVRATEVDVTGGWQVNLDCGGFATATQFLTVTGEDLGTGTGAGVHGPACGTADFSGAGVQAIATCPASPPVVGMQVGGTSFDWPSSGHVVSDETLAAPFYWYLLGCTIDRIVVQQRLDGSITDDGAGTAVSIAGVYSVSGVDLFRTDGSVCFHLSATSPCTFDMQRNDVAAGANVMVTPAANVSVTFEDVLVPGTAGVVPLNEGAATLPQNFQIYGGSLPLFLDVTTTATFQGIVTTCYHYPDANSDGVVDGTTLLEANLQMLHEEGPDFVDRTASLDTVANVICAETTSLSQVTIGTPSAGPPSGVGGDHVLPGRKLLVRRTPSGKESIALISNSNPDVTAPTSGGDNPEAVGATLDVLSDTEGLASFPLVAAYWHRKPSGVYVFKHPQPSIGPVKKAILKPGKILKVKTTSVGGLPLAGTHGGMSMQLRMGSLRHCFRFGGVVKKDEPGRFLATGAPAPVECDPAFGSPSGAFLDVGA